MPVWLSATFSILGGIVGGSLYVLGFWYLKARNKVGPFLGIGAGALVLFMFFIVPLSIIPRPSAAQPLNLFNFYLAGFLLPVFAAIIWAAVSPIRRTK